MSGERIEKKVVGIKMETNGVETIPWHCKMNLAFHFAQIAPSITVLDLEVMQCDMKYICTVLH